MLIVNSIKITCCRHLPLMSMWRDEISLTYLHGDWQRATLVNIGGKKSISTIRPVDCTKGLFFWTNDPVFWMNQNKFIIALNYLFD
jgi:hypothetical protein